MGFERVYTVWDFYDGPRSGIADCSGKPHFYDCQWNTVKGDYADTFTLIPVDDETFSLALEQWAIWREWERTFHRGEVPQSTHPAIPGQDQTYAELEALLEERIPDPSPQDKRARGTFRRIANQPNEVAGVMRELEVEWTLIS